MNDFEVTSRTEHMRGPVFAVVSDEVRMPDGIVAKRDYIAGHLGAVAVVPYDEGRDAVALVNQYRHPVQRRMWELPAGLLDVNGEPPHETAARELAEEADLRAGRYDVLLDLVVSPGCSDEVIRVFLARDLVPVPPPERHVREAEEASMTVEWIPLDEAIGMVLAGTIENATCVAGLLATSHLKARNWQGLRPADLPWTARDLRPVEHIV